jgi:hypothetical protein
MSWLRPAASAVVVALGVAACAPGAGSADETVGRDSAALASHTRVFLVPTGGQARELCRAQINQYYCDEASAAQAVTDCLSTLPASDLDGACAAGGPGCLREEEVDQTCAMNSEIYPTLASCAAPVPDNCAFYSACVEQNRPCGEDGYALGYGERYCTAFKNASFSPKGRAWMTSTMICLQRSLVPYTTPLHSADSCDTVMSAAFAAHPACYTQPSDSICFLPPLDALAVLHTIGVQELFASRTLNQIKSVIGTCLYQIAQQTFLGGLAGKSGSYAVAPEPFGEATGEAMVVPEGLELTEQYAFWQDVAREYEVTPPTP